MAASPAPSTPWATATSAAVGGALGAGSVPLANAIKSSLDRRTVARALAKELQTTEPVLAAKTPTIEAARVRPEVSDTTPTLVAEGPRLRAAGEWKSVSKTAQAVRNDARTHSSASEVPSNTEVPTVSLFGFRGAGSARDLMALDAPHPYVVTGHVGYSFDGGKTIYGFGPKMPDGISAFEAVQSLRNGASYPGVITDDTAIFRSIANSSAASRGGVPQAVIEHRISMSHEQFDMIKLAHNAIGINSPMNNTMYGFPGKNSCTFNCATFPMSIGIPIPEATGNMRNYMPLLEKLGMPWKPE